jgi:NAD(P)-dependent dehydrogenase (short-subunit alcohol dehydrogenase family)
MRIGGTRVSPSPRLQWTLQLLLCLMRRCTSAWSTSVAVAIAGWLIAVPVSVYVLYQPSLSHSQVLEWAQRYALEVGRSSSDQELRPSVESEEADKSQSMIVIDELQLQGRETGALRGITVVVTGATSGIGAALTRQLADLGATVVALGRSSERLQLLADHVKSTKRGFVVPVQADFADLAQVARASEHIHESFPAVDMVVANAGMHSAAAAATQVRTAQGYDVIFGVNYLSHVLLVEKLMPLLLRAERPVVVQVSSLMHFIIADPHPAEWLRNASSSPDSGRGLVPSLWRQWDRHRAYGRSKLAQVLYNRAARRRYPRVRFAASCPGWVATNISRGHPAHLLLHALSFDPSQWGISSTLHALFDEPSRSSDGDYYVNSAVTHALQSRLFDNLAARHSTILPSLLLEATGTATGGLSLLLQKLGATETRIAPSSTSSYNVTLQDQVYAQSLAAVAEWL